MLTKLLFDVRAVTIYEIRFFIIFKNGRSDAVVAPKQETKLGKSRAVVVSPIENPNLMENTVIVSPAMHCLSSF